MMICILQLQNNRFTILSVEEYKDNSDSRY